VSDPQPPPQGRRSSAWAPLVFFAWLQALGALLTVAGLAWTAWDFVQPIVLPLTERSVITVEEYTASWRDGLVLLFFLSMLASIPLAVLTIGFGTAAVHDRRRHVRRLAAFGVTSAALLVAQWWWNVDHTPEDGSMPTPGAAYYLMGAAVVLGLATALLLQVHVGLRRVAMVPPEPSPVAVAGWYADPDDAAAWRWWDGTAWAPPQSMRPTKVL
jgi:hypothetical protein